MNSDRFKLTSRLTALGITYTPSAIAALTIWIETLLLWNPIHRLTSKNEVEWIIERHLLDSAVALPYLSGNTIGDIGTGAGLPGLILAMLDPARQYYLVESSAKRCGFLRHVVGATQLNNVTLVEGVVPNVILPCSLDMIVTRAFRPLVEMVSLTAPLLGPRGSWLAFKGRNWQAEVESLPSEVGLEETIVPLGAKAESVLLRIRKAE